MEWRVGGDWLCWNIPLSARFIPTTFRGEFAGWSNDIPMPMTYQDLRRQVQTAGLLDRSGWTHFPLAMIALTCGVSGFAILATSSGLWRIIAIPLLVVFWIQVGFF